MFWGAQKKCLIDTVLLSIHNIWFGWDKRKKSCNALLKVLWIFQNIFEAHHDLHDSDEKTRMLKTASKKSNRVKSYASYIIMQICK